MESIIHLADFKSLIFGIWQGTLIWEGQSWINWYWFDFAKHHHHWQVSKVRPRAARAPKRPPPLFKAWAFSYKLYWQWTLFLDNLAKMPPNALGTWIITILHFCLKVYDGVPLPDRYFDACMRWIFSIVPFILGWAGSNGGIFFYLFFFLLV